VHARAHRSGNHDLDNKIIAGLTVVRVKRTLSRTIGVVSLDYLIAFEVSSPYLPQLYMACFASYGQ